MDSEKQVFIWPRLFYVYGEGQRSGSLIPSVVSSFKERKGPVLKTPYSKNDFVYVKDVARALVLLLEKASESGVYNIGTGFSTQVKEIVEYIATFFEDVSLPSFSNPSTETEIDFYADIKKIKSLGWEPRVSLQEGIKRYISSE